MKNLYNSIVSICESHYFLMTFPLLAFIFVYYFSYTTSPLYIHEGMDSGVFKSMGLAILKGKIPYVDLFDHKGPILYFVNALGQWLIPGRNGIFLLQIIGESFVFIFLFKIARLFINGLWSFVSVLFTLFIYCGVYQEGNQCEEWILTFTLPAVYLSFCKLQEGCKSYNTICGLLYGICFGLAFYIRPTEAVAIVGGVMTGLTVYFAYNEKWLLCLKNAGWFMIGFTIITIPIISYFYVNKALSDLFYGLIAFNSKYAGSVYSMFMSCVGPHKLPLILMCVTIGIIISNSSYKNILFVFSPISLYCAIIIGRRLYPHYFISYIFFFLLFAIFIIQQKNIRFTLLSVCVLFCSSYSYNINFLKESLSGIKSIAKMNSKPYRTCIDDFYTECDKLFMLVPMECKDSIWNYNLIWHTHPYSSLFFHNDIVQCNRVPYYPMYAIDTTLKCVDNVIINEPPYILLSHDDDKDDVWYPESCRYDRDYAFISENYNCIAKTDSTICNLELYQRKNKSFYNVPK